MHKYEVNEASSTDRRDDKCIHNFSRKSERKRAHERPKHGCDYYITAELKKMDCKRVYWIQLAQNTVQWQALANKAT